jgi:mRNA interferase RelE/StbE
MSYKLKFLPSALKEWEKLDASIQEQFKKKLKERLVSPCIPNSKLSGFENHYKIKLRASGYRLIYEVIDSEIAVLVIAIGKREKNSAYKKARKRVLQSSRKQQNR